MPDNDTSRVSNSTCVAVSAHETHMIETIPATSYRGTI